MAFSAGTSKFTGQPLTDWDHVVQSIGIILTTPIGSRVMLREFGSEVMDLIDRPLTDRVILAVYAATANALTPRLVNGRQLGEPRFAIRSCSLQQVGADGILSMTISGAYMPRGHLGDFTVETESVQAVIPLSA